MLLVCGDLNDTMDAATTQPIFGPAGSQIGTRGFDHPDHGDPQRLWDFGYAMSPPNDYSRVNQGRRELIDHILASHAMIGRLTKAATDPLDVPNPRWRGETVPRRTIARSLLSSTFGPVTSRREPAGRRVAPHVSLPDARR